MWYAAFSEVENSYHLGALTTPCQTGTSYWWLQVLGWRNWVRNLGVQASGIGHRTSLTLNPSTAIVPLELLSKASKLLCREHKRAGKTRETAEMNLGSHCLLCPVLGFVVLDTLWGFPVLLIMFANTSSIQQRLCLHVYAYGVSLQLDWKPRQHSACLTWYSSLERVL